MSDPDADELRLAMTNLSQGGLDGASQLDEHGTLEFWAATYSVQAYALRDYCALYTDLHQLLEQRQAQRGGVVVHVEEETGAVRRAAQRVTRMATVLSCFPAITASCRAFTKTSVGYERRVLALLRADTLKSYAAVFETVARNGLPAGKMGDNVILTCGSLIQGISGVMGVHTVPCDSSDDYNLEIYSEFVKASSARPPMRSIMLRFFARGNELVCVETAAAESHVLDHACRIVLRGLEAEATAAPKSVQRVGRSPDMDMPTLLGHFHLAINKTVLSLVAPLELRQSNGALHPRPLAAPRTGTDPALLALLPAVRGVLSGTGVQMWAAKQLLDVANMAATMGPAAATTGAAEAEGASRYLGLPPAVRTPPRLLTHAVLLSSGHADVTNSLQLALSVARAMWEMTMSGPLAPVMRMPGAPAEGSTARRGVATAAGPAAGGSAAGGASGGGSVAGGSAGGDSAAGGSAASGSAASGSAAARTSSLYRLPRSIPLSAGQVCALITTALNGVVEPQAQGQALYAVRRGSQVQGEMASMVALACRLASELQPQRAAAVLRRLWKTAASWLVHMRAPEAHVALKRMLASLGALLLHEYPGEGAASARPQRATAAGGQVKADGRTLAFAVALEAGLVEWLAAALEGALAGAAEWHVPAYGVAMLTDLLLRPSCALPPLLAHADGTSLFRLLETLRIAGETTRDQMTLRGQDPQATKEYVLVGGNVMCIIVQLLEQVTAVYMRAPPEGLESCIHGPGDSSSGSSAGGVPGAAAAGSGGLPGQPVPDAAAAAIDRTAAALLTKTCRSQVPKQRLRRMWLMTRGRKPFAVLALSRLLPTLFPFRQAAFLDAGARDSVLGLTTVYTAPALQLLRVVLALPAGSSCAASPTAAARQTAALRESRAESWRGLLMADEGVALTWVAAVLAAATACKWPEVTAAALDLLEVLVLALPPEAVAARVQLLDPGKVASSHHACEGCAVAAYCSAECKAAHVRAGHQRLECAGMRAGRETCESLYAGRWPEQWAV
eukprot:XP_001689519.1 predicted protein [Chlamydomonas reinhardtii]